MHLPIVVAAVAVSSHASALCTTVTANGDLLLSLLMLLMLHGSRLLDAEEVIAGALHYLRCLKQFKMETSNPKKAEILVQVTPKSQALRNKLQAMNN